MKFNIVIFIFFHFVNFENINVEKFYNDINFNEYIYYNDDFLNMILNDDIEKENYIDVIID